MLKLEVKASHTLGGAGDGNTKGKVRGVQLVGCCKHDVGVCDDGDKPGERMMGQLDRWVEAISK